MALGPSLLLPPLRDIQRRIEFIDEKYGGKMYLDVLSKEEESRIGEMGGAPRSVVYNFLSTLSEQLYRYNLLKSTIISEKRLKVGLITMLLVLCWILTISLLCALMYFVIYPGFDKYRKINTLDGSLIMTLQYAYFGGIAIVLSAYVIFMTSIFYQKYKKIYDVHYEVESTFNTEPSIQHLVSMMNVLDKNMHVNVSTTRNLRCQGSNPLVGYFIHQNRGIDVRYDCLPSSIIATPEVKNGCVGGGGGPDSVTRKSYNFSNNRKVPYVLTKDSLLNSKNLPCAIFEKRSDKLFVDPFIGKNSLVGNPKVLKKKLDKFDLYGQYNMINNAVLYFETILSRDAIGTSAFQEEIKNEIVVHMKSLLDLSHLILTTNLTPATTFLDKLPPQRKRELISKDEFFFLCLYLPIIYAYYDTSKRTGFFLNENDLDDMVLIFTPRSGQGQSDGNIDLNMSVVKRNRTPMGLSNPTLNIGIENLPAKSMIDGVFKPSKVYDRESNMAFEADIDTSKGTISRRYEDSVLTPKQSNPESAPEYIKLFNMSVLNQKTTLKPVMFIYQMTLETFIVQSRNNFLADMYNYLKDVLLSSIVDKIGQIDSTYNLEIDFRMERDVRIHLEQQFGNDFNLLFNEFTDMINEIPVLMGVKRKEKAQKTGTDPDDIMNKYITFDMFMIALQSMKQEDFLDKFLFNLDALRQTSAGLKQMNDKYNYGFAVEGKNKIMFEVSFYVLVIVGMAELFRLSGLRYIDFRCETMSLEEEMLDAEKWYRNAVDDDEDMDKMTRQSIKREMENSKEDIMRSMVKARNSMILYISILFFIYIFSVSLLYAWKEKTRHVFNYNKYVMNTNGNQIVTDSEHALQTIVQLITEEKQFFFLSSNYKESGDPDELFHLLSENAQIQKDKEIIWTMPPRTSTSTSTEGDSPLKRTYMRLINTIENYKKCNMLVDSSTQQIPFPLIDTITYIMLLLMVIGVLLFAAFKLTPLEHYNNLLNWKHIKELMDQGIEIDPISFDFICHEDDDSKKISYNAITLIVAIIIVIMGILLALSLFRNSSQFATNLYSSDLFSDMKCYD